jgi:hypothetical protein
MASFKDDEIMAKSGGPPRLGPVKKWYSSVIEAVNHLFGWPEEEERLEKHGNIKI